MWPGRSYLVHKDEVINLPAGSGPADVLSPPEAARALSSGSVSTTGAPAGLRTAGDWVHGSKIEQVSSQGMGLAFPSLGRSPSGFQTVPSSGSGVATIPSAGFPSGSGSATAGSGRVSIFNITINGYADIKKLVDAIRRYEAANK